MNRDDDFIGQLEDYLETFEGATRLPDQVRTAVLADLPGRRQVRPVRGPGRMLHMTSLVSTRAGWGAAAVAVAAVVILGAVFIGSGRGPAIGSAPVSPSPSLSPTPSAPSVPSISLDDAPQVFCSLSQANGCLQAGTYGLSSAVWPGQITLDVPAGWFSWHPAADYEGVLVDSRPSEPQGSGWGLMFIKVGAVSIDPCDRSKGTVAATKTDSVDGLVAAMRRWPGFTGTEPTAITVDGFAGQLIELTSNCTSAQCTAQQIWTTPTGATVDAYGMINDQGTAHLAQFRILDVNGTVLVIRTTDSAETSPFEIQQGASPDPNRHASDQAALHGILDSIKVTTASP